MTDLQAFNKALGHALAAGEDAGAVTRVCDALRVVLPGDGMSVTMMTSDVQRQTVFSSDDVMDAFEQAQYTIGEGPSLQAFVEGHPVMVPDATAPSVAARWPGLLEQIAELPLAALFCFPMGFGVISVGVCALHRRTPGPLEATEVSLILDALELTTLVLLQLRGTDRNESLLGRWLAVDGAGRRKVHQATGMVMGQLNVSAESAFARLRGRAFAEGTDIEQVADDVVNRRRVMSRD